jgi:hypothetical protein
MSVKPRGAGLDASDYRVERLRAGRARGGTGGRLQRIATAIGRPRRLARFTEAEKAPRSVKRTASDLGVQARGDPALLPFRPTP